MKVAFSRAATLYDKKYPHRQNPGTPAHLSPSLYFGSVNCKTQPKLCAKRKVAEQQVLLLIPADRHRERYEGRVHGQALLAFAESMAAPQRPVPTVPPSDFEQQVVKHLLSDPEGDPNGGAPFLVYFHPGGGDECTLCRAMPGYMRRFEYRRQLEAAGGGGGGGGGGGTGTGTGSSSRDLLRLLIVNCSLGDPSAAEVDVPMGGGAVAHYCQQATSSASKANTVQPVLQIFDRKSVQTGKGKALLSSVAAQQVAPGGQLQRAQVLLMFDVALSMALAFHDHVGGIDAHAHTLPNARAEL